MKDVPVNRGFTVIKKQVGIIWTGDLSQDMTTNLRTSYLSTNNFFPANNSFISGQLLLISG